MQFAILNSEGLKDISFDLLRPDDYMKLFSYKEYEKYSWENFRLFCHQYARYGIPTVELVSFIREIIGDRSAIEIGSGCGDLGVHLGIPMTDSKQQENPLIVKTYKEMGQPVIRYPIWMEKIDALEAVKKYKPQVVVGSWITTYSPHEVSYGSNPFGVREKEIMELVETFIIIGNRDTHGDKPILKNPHREICEPWILSRAKNPKNNVIYILDKLAD